MVVYMFGGAIPEITAGDEQTLRERLNGRMQAYGVKVAVKPWGVLAARAGFPAGMPPVSGNTRPPYHDDREKGSSLTHPSCAHPQK